MNKETPHRDQAEKLRRRIEKITEEPFEETNGLPPRSKVHNQKKKKTSFKLKYPLIRLLALFFILLPIVSFSIYTINKNNQLNTEPATTDSNNIELVDVEKDEESGEDGHVSQKEAVKEPAAEKPQGKEEPSVAEGEASTRHENDKEAEAKDNEQQSEEKEFVYHKVQPNETLFRISLKYYHSQAGIERIRQENGIQGNDIKVGQTLKIPLN